MKHFLSAIQFLTILPVPGQLPFLPERMVPCFPLVGLFLGLVVGLVDLATSYIWSPMTVALLDVVLLAILTGALHIDGLGDAADGLLGHHTQQRALEIMKDSRVGAMGLVAIWCGLGLKWMGIAGMSDHRFLFFLAIPALARGGLIAGLATLPYGRPEGGKGQAFFNIKPGIHAFCFLVIPLAILILTGWRGIWVTLGFVGIVWSLLQWYKRRMECITGDMLGAMCEVTETVLFLIASAGGATC